MTSITTWNRLEPRVRDRDLRVPLQARLRDPLWMLTSQWQMGEFQGEDAASPIDVAYKLDVSRLTRYAPGPLTKSVPGEPYDPETMPL